MNLDLLRTFLAVHRAGSVTAGAAVLGLAQPTVTVQLRALEAALGRQLFERLPRGVRATAAGDELASRLVEPIDALERLLLEDEAAPYPTTVRLGGPADLLCERVLPALGAAVSEGLQLRATFGLPEALAEALLGGLLDLAVLSVRPRRRGLVVEPLFDEEFVLVAAPAWADRVGVASTPDRLREVPLVAYGEDSPILRRYWRTVYETQLTRTPDLVVSDLRGVRAAVVAGAGASVLPAYLCAAELASGALQALLEPELPPLNTLLLTYRPSATGQRSVAVVRDLLLTAARSW